MFARALHKFTRNHRKVEKVSFKGLLSPWKELFLFSNVINSHGATMTFGLGNNLKR